MQKAVIRYALPAGIALATCFGVFYLPFLLPPPFLYGQSAANVAGFNNKVASIAAAILGIVVFGIQFRWGQFKTERTSIDGRPLPRRFLTGCVLLITSILTVFSLVVLIAHIPYNADAGYFIEQIGKHAEFGRKLYDQIEFPYGPLLFYTPIWVRAILAPLHVSLAAAYFVTLVVFQALGLMMVAYVLDGLPVSRGVKTLFFVLCIVLAVPVNLGTNYTFFRFVSPCFLLVVLGRQGRPARAAGWAVVGQMFCLAISPELAFSFLSGSLVYAAYRCYQDGRAWASTLAAPVVATAIFLAIVGGGYVRMLRMFAHGINNLVVGPVPHVLVLLFALVWMAPVLLARSIRERRPEAALFLALYVSGLALLPAAFGRCDPQHTFFNGLAIYFLSLVAISRAGAAYRYIWNTTIAVLLLWTALITARYPQCAEEYRDAFSRVTWRVPVLKHTLLALSRVAFRNSIMHHYSENHEDRALDLARLQQYVGKAPVFTPIGLPLTVEEELKRTGHFVPSFYAFQNAVLDVPAEKRNIRETNSFEWMLLPRSYSVHQVETPESTEWMMGFKWPYRTRHTPYVAGTLVNANIATNWVPYAKVGDFDLLRRR